MTLATKFAIRRSDEGARFFDNSAAHIREALDGSLTRLGVDHIYLYYVHRVDQSIPIEDTIGELARLVKAGAIGAIGLSEVAPDTLRRAHAVHPIAAVQSEFSLRTRGPELGLIQACAELSAILVAFSPLGRGYLTGLLQNVETFAEKDFRCLNPALPGRQLAAQSRPARRLCRARQVMGAQARDASHRLDARPGAAHSAHSRRPHRGPSRRMRGR